MVEWWRSHTPIVRYLHFAFLLGVVLAFWIFTSGVTAVTPTDRPKSVRNRCVIKVFGGFFYIVTLFFGFFCWCRCFFHRTESDLFLFLFHFNTLQISSKLLTHGYRYHKLRKTFGQFFRSYSELLSNFGDISLQEYVSKGISHPVFYGDLVYKLRRVKDTSNFFSSGSKIVKRLRRRQYAPLIIERTICLVVGPSTALYRPFLKHCTLINKAMGTIWWTLSKPPQRRQGPDLLPLWLLVGDSFSHIPELASRRAEHSLPYTDVTIYIFDI